MVTRVIKINYSFGTTLINTSSTEKVMRIIKMITKGKILNGKLDFSLDSGKPRGSGFRLLP